MNVKHSTGSPNWITPGEGQKVDYVSLIRNVLDGVIELDPYSSDLANTVIQALRYYTPKDNGHARPWTAETVYVNHPGLQTVESWRKLCQEVLAGHAKKVVWMGFSVEQLNLLAEPCNLDDEDRFAEGLFHPTDFSMLYTRNRIDFIDDRTMKKGGRPSHGNYICGVGVSHAKFCEVFGHLGHITAGPLSLE